MRGRITATTEFHDVLGQFVTRTERIGHRPQQIILGIGAPELCSPDYRPKSAALLLGQIVHETLSTILDA